MKQILLILSIFLLASAAVFAQSPESFKYQAIVRDVSGSAITDQTIGLQIEILEGSETGVSIYTETHSPMTNNFGLINLNIGEGSVQSGNFSTIDWGSDSYYVKVSIDITGGTSYTEMGTSQLHSVPYSFHAKTVENYNETDPIFTASPANGITGINITNWNTAYTWGDHSTAGYLNSELWSQNGSNIYYNSGNVGIGTSNPLRKLDINGNIRLTGGDMSIELASGYLNLVPHDTNYGLILRDYTGLTSYWSSFKTVDAATDYLHIAMNSISTNEGICISDNANVGIGTSTPNAKLDVKADADDIILFEVKDKDNNPVFSVYPDYVQVTVPDDGVKASKHGAFIVTGRSAKDSKLTTDITRLTKENYLIGHNAGVNITGTKNSIIGYEAGYGLTGGSYNVMLGYQSGFSNSVGNYNSFIGYYSGRGNIGGNQNVFVGNRSGQSNTSGSSNIFIGVSSGALNQTGAANTAIGESAGYNVRGSYNVFIGNLTGFDNTRSDNVMIGSNAGENNNGYRNVFLGSLAGYYETGSDKLYIENSSTSLPLIYGDFNTDYLRINGDLYVYTSSTSTVGADYVAKFQNDGNHTYRRGLQVIAGQDNGSTTGDIIFVECRDGNSTYLGSLYSRNGALQIAAKSASKSKSIITETSKNAFDIINKLEVVNYKLDTSNKSYQTGFIGEDAIKVFPEMVKYDKEEDAYMISYTALIPVITKALQVQQKEIEDLKLRLEKLENK